MLVYLAIFIICISCGDNSWLYQTKDLRYFDYSNLYKNENQTMVTYSRNSSLKPFTIMFNLWRDLDLKCLNKSSMGIIYPSLASDFDTSWNILQTFEPSSRFVEWNSKSDEESHLKIEFRSNERCYYAPDGTKVLGGEDRFFGLDIELKWDDSDREEGPKTIITSDQNETNSDLCQPKITIKSKEGCMIPKVAAFAVFFEQNYWIFALTFIAFGIYNIYYGAKMFALTILFFGIFSTVTFVFVLIFIVFEVTNMHQFFIWLILALSIIVGILTGFFMARIFKIGVWVIGKLPKIAINIYLGWWTGLVFAILIDSFTFNKLGITFMLYILMVIFMAVFGFLSYRYYEYVLIASSSILGAYFFVRGVSLFTGGYPNEAELFRSIKYGTSSQYVAIPWSFYFYLGLMFILR